MNGVLGGCQEECVVVYKRVCLVCSVITLTVASVVDRVAVARGVVLIPPSSTTLLPPVAVAAAGTGIGERGTVNFNSKCCSRWLTNSG